DPVVALGQQQAHLLTGLGGDGGAVDLQRQAVAGALRGDGVVAVARGVHVEDRAVLGVRQHQGAGAGARGAGVVVAGVAGGVRERRLVGGGGLGGGGEVDLVEGGLPGAAGEGQGVAPGGQLDPHRGRGAVGPVEGGGGGD